MSLCILCNWKITHNGTNFINDCTFCIPWIFAKDSVTDDALKADDVSEVARQTPSATAANSYGLQVDLRCFANVAVLRVYETVVTAVCI